MTEMIVGVSKAVMAKELGVTVPDITRKLKVLGIGPFDENLLSDAQVFALRNRTRSSATSPSPTQEMDLGVGEEMPLPDLGKDRKFPQQLADQFGCTVATVLRYAKSADAAWRPDKPIAIEEDGRFSPEAIALITDAYNGVSKWKSHDIYIRRRAVWLESYLTPETAEENPPSMNQVSDRTQDEADIAGVFSQRTRELNDKFAEALNHGLMPLVEQAKYELSGEALERRFTGLLVAELAKGTQPEEEPKFSILNLFKASGRMPRRLSFGAIAGLLSEQN